MDIKSCKLLADYIANYLNYLVTNNYTTIVLVTRGSSVTYEDEQLFGQDICLSHLSHSRHGRTYEIIQMTSNKTEKYNFLIFSITMLLLAETTGCIIVIITNNSIHCWASGERT